MPWILGIDEAGYGPNLGPFVMSSALFSLPDGCSTDLWKVLRSAVRKASDKADGRLIVDDSKQVYSPRIGLGPLEKHLWPFLLLTRSSIRNLKELWEHASVDPIDSLLHEPFLDWQACVPLSTPTVSSAAMLAGVMNHTGVKLESFQCNIVSPRQFNKLTREADSKAAVPLYSISRLVAALPDYGSIDIHVDRLGGRQRYSDQVAKWFPGKEIVIESETPRLSRYRVGERISISFQVEADQQSFPVALASMLSKYWRELLMMQFNTWFATQQPGVQPTAGYPLDATRFWQDVEPTRQRLNLTNDDWWRER